MKNARLDPPFFLFSSTPRIRDKTPIIMISVEHLSKAFRGVPAVQDVSFTIPQGEIVGFLGPNGAGKSTTMRMMAGFLAPDEGRVKINGACMQTDPIAAKRLLGYLPENNPLYKHLLVSEYLAFCMRLRGMHAAEQKAALDFAVPALGINEVFYRPLHELSKGYKQRVGIAQAILHSPPFIMLDEPTEGLDPNQRNEIRSLIRGLSQEHTILMSTHVMQEVAAVCSRILLISKGELLADTTPEALRQTADGTRVMIVEVDGADVCARMGERFGADAVELVARDNQRHTIRLRMTTDDKAIPNLSAFIAGEQWILWRMQEERRDLESAFRELTQTL